MTGESRNNNNSKRIMTIVVSVLIIALIVLIIYMFSNKSYYNQLLEEKEIQRVELQSELDSLMVEHDKIKVEYGALSDSLSLKDSIILANADEIKKLLDTKYEYTLVKRKLDKLREVSKGYLRQMDSLYTLNRALTIENNEMKKEVAREKERSNQLQKDKIKVEDQITKAAILKAYNVTATPVRTKGGGKEETTNKKSRVERIKISFTLGENKLITAGKKTIYVRISDPFENIICKSRSDEYSFRFSGQILQFTMKEIVDYDGSAKPVSIYWTTDGDKMKSGSYNVTIYSEDSIIGYAAFTID